jgi:predicted nucleotidyltransferase
VSFNREGINIFANELKKEPQVVGVYLFGSQKTGFSQFKNRPVTDDSDTDIGVIHRTGPMVRQEVIKEIITRHGLEDMKIEVCQRSEMAAQGDDFYNGLFSTDTVVYAILAGEKL